MGKKSPDKEPDYTKERAAFAKSELANRQKQADAYNTKVNSYNSTLGNLNSQLSALGDSMRNLTIKDDEKWGGLLSSLSNYEKQFNNLQAGLGSASSKPTFNSMVQSAYGPVEVGLPNLVDQNTTLANTFSSQIGNLRTMLEGLQSKRKAEEERIDSFSSSLASSLSGLGSQISGYKIADKAGIDTAKARLAELRSSLTGFNSSILGEYKPYAVKSYQDQIKAYDAQLSALLAQRAAEEGRIRNYETDLNTGYDALNSRFGALTIADLAGIEQLQRDIDNRQTAAARFSSALNFDLNDELGQYSDLETRLGELRSKREAEALRVKNAEDNARTGIGNIMMQLSNADIYNAGMLNQLGGAIDQGLNDINSFSSVLGANFAPVLGQIDQAKAQLQQLRERRNAALSGYGTKAEQLLAKIGGLDLANESGINSSLAEAQQLAQALGQFTGNDVTSFRDKINAAIAAANGRLGDLSTERNSIEAAARSMLNNARSSQFATVSDIDALAAQLAGISTRQANFNATQATDEIDAITALIAGERNRIKADEAAALARQQKEQEAYQKFAGFGPQYSGFGSYAYNANPWFGGGGRAVSSDLPSSFARQLNVVYA